MRLWTYLCAPKTTIGWVHGVVTLLGAYGLAYLSGMSLSLVFKGDAAMRLLPSMLLTPLFSVLFWFWLLFSKTLLDVMVKIVLMAFFNACIIAFF